MGTVVELLDRLEDILKESLPEERAREAKRVIEELSREIAKDTLDKEIPYLEEKLSKRLATKEDLYKVREELKEEIARMKNELYQVREELKGDFQQLKQELLTVKILLWVVLVLTGLASLPQLVGFFKLLK